MSIATNAIEAFGLVEVEVGRHDPRREIEESLDSLELRQRVVDQRVSVHDVNLLQGKVLEPVPHVHVVEASLDRFVARVQRAVLHQHVLDGLNGLVVLQPVEVDLRVIRDDSLRRVSEDQQESDGRVHAVNPRGSNRRREIPRRLLHRDLMRERIRHLLAIPIEAFGVVLVPVEEVDFSGGRCHFWMNIQHFQQRSRSSFPDADDDAVRSVFAGSWRRDQRRGDSLVSRVFWGRSHLDELWRSGIRSENQEQHVTQKISHGEG